MTSENSEIVRVSGVPFVANYNWSVGLPMERFIKALADKKILASKCPACGYTYTPPRNRCGKCNAAIEDKDIIELSGKGSLQSYTTARVELDGAGNFKDLEKPKLIGAIKLDGADSTIFMPLSEVDPEKVATGMKVQVKWKKETKGELADMESFKPE